MSADNYIAVYKGQDGKFRGYMKFASDDEVDYDGVPFEPAEHLAQFTVSTVEQAIIAAQGIYTEYGYHFVGLEE